MTMYVQYDDDGNITATVVSYGVSAPVCDKQLIFEDTVNTDSKMVDVVNQVLIDIR